MRVDPTETHVAASGRRKDDRFDDDALAALGGFVAAEQVVLHRQELTRIPTSLGELKRPFALYLSGNTKLKSFAGIEELTGLRKLVLGANGKADLGEAFVLLGELPELATVELLTVRALPASIRKLANLIELRLTVEQRFDLAGALAAIAKLPALRVLCLSRLAKPIPDALGGLTRLEQLVLERSKVTSLPKTIGRLKALQVLDAGFNKLSKLPDELFDCTALHTLDLACNPLAELSPRVGKLRALVRWSSRSRTSRPSRASSPR